MELEAAFSTVKKPPQSEPQNARSVKAPSIGYKLRPQGLFDAEPRFSFSSQA
jgi:hypothetical protein